MKTTDYHSWLTSVYAAVSAALSCNATQAQTLTDSARYEIGQAWGTYASPEDAAERVIKAGTVNA